MSPTGTEVIAAISSLAQSGVKALSALKSTFSETHPSESQFLTVRQFAKQNRRRLANIAALMSPYASGRGAFQYTPLMAFDEWTMKEPLQLGMPSADLNDDSDTLVTTVPRRELVNPINRLTSSTEYNRHAARILPTIGDESRILTKLTSAIEAYEKPNPKLFVNRPSYALSSVAGSHRVTLSFQPAKYFDYIDCGEMLSYEMAFSVLDMLARSDHPMNAEIASAIESKLELRRLAGEWNAISFRPSVAGVNVLTIFTDSASRTASFPIMLRGSATATAGQTFHVVPAGEFQPTTESKNAWFDHCTLWQTVLREFAEEIMLDKEAKSHGLDMRQLAKRPKISPLLELIRGGHWKTYFLGLGLDALTLKPELLLVSLIDKKRFVEATGISQLPRENTEGDILSGHAGWGEDLVPPSLLRYRDDEDMTLPACSGCIELLQRNWRSIVDTL